MRSQTSDNARIASTSTLLASRNTVGFVKIFRNHWGARLFKFKQWGNAAGLAVLLSMTAPADAAMSPILTQGFDGLALGAVPANWVVVNRSTLPADNWGGGNANIFAAQSGAAGSYIADSFEAGGGSGVVSDWLLTPVVNLDNGFTFSFYTRGDVNAGSFADSLQVRLSTSGSSTNVGTTPTDLGVFTTLLLSVNSTLAPGGFPTDWTPFTATVSGLAAPTTGRFALRYFLNDNVTQGSYIGVDSIVVSAVVSAVPEPETLLLLALGLTAMGLTARRRFHG